MRDCAVQRITSGTLGESAGLDPDPSLGNLQREWVQTLFPRLSYDLSWSWIMRRSFPPWAPPLEGGRPVHVIKRTDCLWGESLFPWPSIEHKVVNSSSEIVLNPHVYNCNQVDLWIYCLGAWETSQKPPRTAGAHLWTGSLSIFASTACTLGCLFLLYT